MTSKEKKRLIAILIILGIPFFVVFWAILYYGVQVYFNLSDSLPDRVFIALKRPEPGLTSGTYIIFKHPEFKDQNIIKKIDGVAGDQLEVTPQGLLVNRKLYPLFSHTQKGKRLTPNTIQRVPNNFYFVSGTHSKSYDSRYAEFGLVHQSQIKGQVWPLF